VLPPDWFARDAPIVAADLLGKVLSVEAGGVVTSGRIVETEAYTADDPASHSFRGPTARNEMMFGRAGRLYVYLSYGIHRCANVVTGAPSDGQAVLIRAIEPIEGLDEMLRRRGRVPLADGPGKLCEALGITLEHSGADLTGEGSIRILDDGTEPPVHPLAGPRIGITKAVDVPWRFRTPER
jgi:DNA-3-methyladenine glycosylase